VFRVCKSLCCSKSAKVVDIKKLRIKLLLEILRSLTSAVHIILESWFEEYRLVLKVMLRRKKDCNRVSFKFVAPVLLFKFPK
jgi:hypothetical protein